MKSICIPLFCLALCLNSLSLKGQTTDSTYDDPSKIVDVVVLKDGSKLSGTILKWELARGMEFKLITGATVILSKDDIDRVFQDIPFDNPTPAEPINYYRAPKPYRFKDEGVYQTFSVFLNTSEMGGAGVHY